MEDREIGRLKRLLFWSWCLIVFLIISAIIDVIFWFNAQFKSIKKQINESRTQQIIEKPGKDGYTPVKGVDYFDGTDGVAGHNGVNGLNAVNTITLQPIYSNVPIPGPQGEVGPDGAQGQTGKTGPVTFVQQLPTGEWQCRFGDDINWQPITECR